VFDTNGSFIPSSAHKVYSSPPSGYYKFNLHRSPSDIVNAICSLPDNSERHLRLSYDKLYDEISQDKSLSNLLCGPFIPFGINRNLSTDIGSMLELDLLPSLNTSFLQAYPDSHFKVVTQDKQHLAGRLSPVLNSGYQQFLSSVNNSNVIGYYFPSAFPEFSISSQREAFKAISTSLSICLSGPLEVVSASITNPSLLINTDHYSPILCMSGVRHDDERLEAVLKSYGPHLEFWVLSNVLTPGVEQVSEQWYGGLTIYKSFD
jgi:hypothetical protein